VLVLLLAPSLAWAQQPQEQATPPGAAAPPVAAPLTALVEDLVGYFPKVQGEVIEVSNATLTLDVGQKDGARPGLDIELYREGREIKHPKTGAVLGKTEDTLGAARITRVQEAFSTASPDKASEVKPGDRFRVSSTKINLTLVSLLGSVKENL